MSDTVGVVVDIGGYSVHVGFSGDEAPTHTFPTTVEVESTLHYTRDDVSRDQQANLD